LSGNRVSADGCRTTIEAKAERRERRRRLDEREGRKRKCKTAWWGGDCTGKGEDGGFNLGDDCLR
jgi:hypothetical protein